MGSHGLDSRTAIFVISGNQGAGKSTVARALAGRFERGVHIEGDTLQKMIVSGLRWPEARVMSDEASRQLRLRVRNMCLLARSFFGAGFTAVMDDIIVGERVEHLLEELGDEAFFFVMLTPREGAIRERERGRGTNLFEEWSWLDEEIRTGTKKIGLWVDTSDQSVEETVDEIVRRAWSEGRVG